MRSNTNQKRPSTSIGTGAAKGVSIGSKQSHINKRSTFAAALAGYQEKRQQMGSSTPNQLDSSMTTPMRQKESSYQQHQEKSGGRKSTLTGRQSQNSQSQLQQSFTRPKTSRKGTTQAKNTYGNENTPLTSNEHKSWARLNESLMTKKKGGTSSTGLNESIEVRPKTSVT